MSFDLEGWILTYRRPDLDEDCFAGPFGTEDEGWAYARDLPPDRTVIGVAWGVMRLTPKPQDIPE